MPRLTGRSYVEAFMGTRPPFLRALVSSPGQWDGGERLFLFMLQEMGRFWLAHFELRLVSAAHISNSTRHVGAGGKAIAPKTIAV